MTPNFWKRDLTGNSIEQKQCIGNASTSPQSVVNRCHMPLVFFNLFCTIAPAEEQIFRNLEKSVGCFVST